MTQTPTSPFVTAEDSQNYRGGVWVLLTTLSMLIDGEIIPSSFVITTSTGYRAELRACMSDLCTGYHSRYRPRSAPAFIAKAVCLRPLGSNGQHPGQSIDAWCEHVRTHCHGPHIEHAQAFAAAVGATYGSASKRETALTGPTSVLTRWTSDERRDG